MATFLKTTESYRQGARTLPGRYYTAPDGRLIGAPHMHEVEGFDKKAYPLHAVALAEWEGFLFVNLDPSAEPLERAFGPLAGRFARYNLPALRSVRRIEYEVRANWKLI